MLADNKLALNAGWDRELLAIELQGLIDLDFDVELTGFSLGRDRHRAGRGARDAVGQGGGDGGRGSPASSGGGAGGRRHTAGRRVVPGPPPADLWRRP